MPGELERVPLAQAIDALRTEIRSAAERALALAPKSRFRITEA
jgi:hypothetical protein